MSEDIYYLGFAVFPGIGPALFTKLLQKLGTAQSAWDAPEKELLAVLQEKVVKEFIDFREKFEFEKYIKELKDKKIRYVTLIDDDYPELLRNMAPLLHGSIIEHDNETLKQSSNLRSPFVLFYKGNKSLLNEKKTIGIVGTRSITSYGRDVTQMLTHDLVQQGFIIVSGLALGVDGVAHETCLNANGKTIAVLGSGVDICTPPYHQKLYDRILEQDGLIVSTVPPGEEPNRGSFPARNKIIAGLSLGVILTEGAADSGALYTADFAKDMGRPVFAVPGPITSRLSAATTKLLKDGATLVTRGKDVVDKLRLQSAHRLQTTAVDRRLKADSKEEEEILLLLANEPLHFNELVKKTHKDPKDIGSILSVLELKGSISSTREGIFKIIDP